jgi:hypothetical protein
MADNTNRNPDGSYVQNPDGSYNRNADGSYSAPNQPQVPLQPAPVSHNPPDGSRTVTQGPNPPRNPVGRVSTPISTKRVGAPGATLKAIIPPKGAAMAALAAPHLSDHGSSVFNHPSTNRATTGALNGSLDHINHGGGKTFRAK